MSRGAQTLKQGDVTKAIKGAVRPRLIFQHTAAKISGAEAEAILGFTVDRSLRYWLRGCKVYVRPSTHHWLFDIPPRTLVSYEENEEVAALTAPHRIRLAENAAAKLLRRRA
jgi:hypothetical protein